MECRRTEHCRRATCAGEVSSEIDEDTATIAVEAARNAVNRAEIDSSRIGAIYTGSESYPYAVKPTGTIVADAIGATPDLTVADFEFACKAGTAGIQTCMGWRNPI